MCAAGWKAAAKNGLIGGGLLAVFEGFSIFAMKSATKKQMEEARKAGLKVDDLSPPIPPPVGNWAVMAPTTEQLS